MNDIAAQRRALREGALLRDAPEFATLVVTGSDRQSWLHGLVTCNVKALATGQAAYGLSVGKTGRVVADLWVAVAPDATYVAVAASRLGEVAALFEQHLIMEDAELARAPDLAWLFAYGPLAERVLEQAAARAPSAGVMALGHYGDLPTVALVGAGAALAAARERSALQPGVALATEPGWLHVRIEHVLPRYGTDFDAAYPQEASLERLAVAFDKGCYLGQEAVFMLEKRGQASRRLVLLSVEGEGELQPASPVTTLDGAEVGSITSASAADGTTIALATLRRAAARTGSELCVAGRAARVTRGLDP